MRPGPLQGMLGAGGDTEEGPLRWDRWDTHLKQIALAGDTPLSTGLGDRQYVEEVKAWVDGCWVH